MAEAQVNQIEAAIADMTLRAPVSGRVEYRLARTGEVVGAGGRVLTVFDLSDAHMTIYLPTASAGRVLFFGTAEHLPNHDAFAWLAAEVWPKIKAAHPAATCHIATGRLPDRLMSALARAGGQTWSGGSRGLSGGTRKRSSSAAMSSHELRTPAWSASPGTTGAGAGGAPEPYERGAP